VATTPHPAGGRVDLLDTYDDFIGCREPVPLVAACQSNDYLSYTRDRLLHLTIERLGPGICVVVVAGELDMHTVPLLERCLRTQLAVGLDHLVVDLQPVRFLGSNGLTCLLRARQLAQQAPETQLHLSGLINRVVRRALDITGVCALFNSYLTLADARAVVGGTGSLTVDPPPAPAPRVIGDPTDRSPGSVPSNVTGPLVLAAVWCSSVATAWTLELREVTSNDQFGALVDSINSGVPVSQPAPHAQVQELVAPRGLWLFCESPAGPSTSNRYHFGYVSVDTDP
jgi:anti-sigma B factor antagonist